MSSTPSGQTLMSEPPPGESLLSGWPDPEAGTILYAKTRTNGTAVSLSGKRVTARTGKFTGCIYIEEPDRSCGIRVVTADGPFAAGDEVSVSGTMATTADHERFINNATVTKTATPGPLKPLGMLNREVAGRDFCSNEINPTCQLGVLEAVSLNNVGLWVKVWGEVKAVNSQQKFFYIDDGSNLDDTTGNGLGLRVSYADQSVGADNPEITPPQEGWFVSVTGISSVRCIADCETGDPTLIRVLKIGSRGDVIINDPEDVQAYDWPMFMHDQHHTGRATYEDTQEGVGAGQTVKMYKVWTAEVPTLSGCRCRYPGDPNCPPGFTPLPENHRFPENRVDHPIFDSSPVIKRWVTTAGNTVIRVFVGGFEGTYPSSTGKLYCFNLLGTPDGQGMLSPLWTYPSQGSIGGVASTPAVARVNLEGGGSEMRVFFGCMDGKVYALDAESGQLRWAYDSGEKILSSPVVSNDVVYIGTEGNRLLALQAGTSNPAGSEAFAPLLLSDPGSLAISTSSPAVVSLDGHNCVFINSDDGHLYKVGGAGHPQAGSVLGTYPPSGELRCIESSPSYLDGVIYFGESSPFNDVGQTNVYAVYASNLQLRWQTRARSEVRTTAALCSHGVYLGDETGYHLYRYALAGPEPEPEPWLDIIDLGGHVFASPALTLRQVNNVPVPSLVYAGSDNGILRAYNLLNFDESPGNKLRDQHGQPLDLGGAISSSPAICYTHDGDSWRRWVLVTARRWHYDGWGDCEPLQSLLYAFSSRL